MVNIQRLNNEWSNIYQIIIALDNIYSLYKGEIYLKAYEPKGGNFDDIYYEVNSLRLGGLHL